MLVEVCALGLLLIVLSAAAWRRWGPPAYVGTSQRVTLTWTCSNGIVFGQEPGKAFWWAGQNPASQGRVATTSHPVPNGPPDTADVATGRLHFDNRNVATFHSDAGGTLTLRRFSASTFAAAYCSLTPVG